MLTKIPTNIFAFLLLGAFLVATSSVSALWQGPTQTPPGGNVSAPINVGNNAQIKEGNLTLNATNSFLNGLLVPYGNVGIGTTNPQGKLEIISGGCYYRFKSDGLRSNCPYIIDETYDYDLVIASDTANYNLATVIGKPSSSKKIRVTINSGVVVSSTSTGSPAFDTGKLPSGLTVKIVNNGSIIGKGGNGGRGGGVWSGGCCWNQSVDPARVGEAGGNALELRLPVTIDNTNGNIWGGGGGGGGGAGAMMWSMVRTGGAGGGGAGGGVGSTDVNGPTCYGSTEQYTCGGGNYCTARGAAGANGGIATGPGAGGAGSSGGPSNAEYNEDGNCQISGRGGGTSGNGGTGGDYGQLGSTGGSSSVWGWCGCSGDNYSQGGGAAGGAAGKAVNTNSNTVTWLGGNDATRVKGAVN